LPDGARSFFRARITAVQSAPTPDAAALLIDHSVGKWSAHWNLFLSRMFPDGLTDTIQLISNNKEFHDRILSRGNKQTPEFKA
jgi:hypothetical protein